MRAYYRNQTIRDHRRPGRHWYTVDGFALQFDSSAAAVRWIDTTLEAATPRCRTASHGRRSHAGSPVRGGAARLADRRLQPRFGRRVLAGSGPL